MIVPPIIASAIIGLSAYILSYGISVHSPTEIAKQTTAITSGGGVLIGFAWGALIWTEKLASIYNPSRRRDRIYDAEASSVFAPSTAYKTIRIELSNSQGGFMDMQYIDLPEGITVEKLVKISQMIVSTGYVFSHTLSGKHAPLSRAEFEALRDILIARGLAKWNNPSARNQGVCLLAPGKAMFRQLTTYQEGALPRLAGLLSKK